MANADAWATIVSAVVGAMALVIAAWIAKAGISQAIRRKVALDRVDLAIEALKTYIKAREAIKQIRTETYHPSAEELDDLDTKSSLERYKHINRLRISKYSNLFQECERIHILLEIYYEDVAHQYYYILKVWEDLKRSIQYYSDRAAGSRDAYTTAAQELYEKTIKIKNNGEDEIENTIRTNYDHLNNILKKQVIGKSQIKISLLFFDIIVLMR
ncbi:hypothetical protein [Glycocaulis alkaliphilus]|uniref:hypothetical protein n=1 Tax=Glycocaulis alkaliphilus TaxID=1434191 RepID=UPI000FDCD503|nr:hypothetical protein [Glycocaulis alkaliphilus]